MPESSRSTSPRGVSAVAHRARGYLGETRTAWRAKRAPDGVTGLLSVIVPVYQVEDYLDECLQSLRDQDYRRIEIIAVDDGSTDGSLAIAQRHRREDRRVRIVRRPNGGLSAARNTGVEAARGEFLTFVDSDDTVTKKGFVAALESLVATGSDFAVLRYRRLRGKRFQKSGPWIRELHRTEHLGVTIDELPDAFSHAMACSKVFRTSFWRSADLNFAPGVLFEDQIFSAQAYTRARRFDVLNTTLSTGRMREAPSRISTWGGDERALVERLNHMLDAVVEVVAILRARGSEELLNQRLVHYLSRDLSRFVARAPIAGEEYWSVLHQRIPGIIAELPRERYLDDVNVKQRIWYRLVALNDRAGAIEAIAGKTGSIRRVEISYAEDGAYAHYPGWDEVSAGTEDRFSADAFRLSTTETRLHAGIRRARMAAPGVLDLEGWAAIRNVDLVRNPPTTSARVVHESGAVVDLPVRTFTADWMDEVNVGGSALCDHRPAAVAMRIDTTGLRAGSWTLEVEVVAAGMRRKGPMRRAAGGLRTGNKIGFSAGARARSAVYSHESGSPATLTVEEGGAVVEGISVPMPGVVRLRSAGPHGGQLVMRRRDGTTLEPASLAPADGGYDIEFELARSDGAPGLVINRSAHWTVVTSDNKAVRMATAAPAEPVVARFDDDALILDPGVGTTGAIVVRQRGAIVLVHGHSVEAEAITLDVEIAGVPAEQVTPRLVTERATIDGTLEESGTGFHVRLPLQWAGFDGVIRPAPTALYDIDFVDGQSGLSLPARIGPAAAATLPTDVLTDDVRVVLETRPSQQGLRVVADVRPPLTVDERGPRNAARLEDLANGGSGTDHAVFFRTLYGEATNDSALAIHRELRRRGSSRTLYWAIEDRSVPVPDGGEGVVEGSRRWYEALGGAGHVVINVHQPGWYTKPTRQCIVETFHGYPYKLMGRGLWSFRDLPASRVDSYLDRAADWAYLVSPARYATPLLLREFFDAEAAAKVEVIEAGYPRNDLLLGANGAGVRARVRGRLGLDDDETAVLYGPTFRDALSGEGQTAHAADYLDSARFAEALGPGYVLLNRGHAFNARGDTERVSHPQVLDVTYYPDITDLILASDAAILDYSSLRFDYALTRKPMVFLVPDEEEYHRARPGLLPYDKTSPGPHVATTDEVVAELRDPDALRAHWSEAVEEFIATYMEKEDGHAAERVVDAVFPDEKAPKL